MDVKLFASLVLMLVPLLQAQSTTTPTTINPNGIRCSSGKDCPVNMCCVHNPLSRPPRVVRRSLARSPGMARRFLFEEFSQHDHGYCRYERKTNESCFPLGHDHANPALYEFFCPCLQSLECRGQQVHESQHSLVHISPICQTLEN